MRAPALIAVCASLSLLCLAGCGRDAPPAPATDTPPAARPAPAPAPPPGPDVEQRYACDAGPVVDLLREGRAVARLPDGTQVDMARVADSVPPTYTGANLYFTVGDTGAHLSQSEGTELACQPQ